MMNRHHQEQQQGTTTKRATTTTTTTRQCGNEDQQHQHKQQQPTSCAITQDEFGIQLPFPYKLHKMLQLAEERKYDDIISWLPNGLAFRVHKRDELIKATIPGFFKQTKYKSFLRQLNMWGFVRIVGGAYYHENFRRDNPELCHLLTRVPKSKSRATSPALKFSGPDSAAAAAAGAASAAMMNNKMMLPQPNESTQRGLALLNDLVDSSSSSASRSGGSNSPTTNANAATVARRSSNVNALSIQTIIEDDLFGSFKHLCRNSSTKEGNNSCTADDAHLESIQWLNSVIDPCDPPPSTVTSSSGGKQSQVQMQQQHQPPSILSQVFDWKDNEKSSSSSCQPLIVQSLTPAGAPVAAQQKYELPVQQMLGGGSILPINRSCGHGGTTSARMTMLMEPRSIEAMTKRITTTCNNVISKNSQSSSSSDELFQDGDLATVLGEYRYVDDEGRNNNNNTMFVSL